MRIGASPRGRRPGRRGLSDGVWLVALSGATVVVVLCTASPVAAAGWSTQLLPSSWALGAVSCADRSACTAVGSLRGEPGHGLTLAARWDGRRWFQQHTPSTAGGADSLTGVSCTSRTACMAVGWCYCSAVFRPLAQRWNGRQWSVLRVPHRRGATLNAVSCSSPSACTAVGSTNATAFNQAVLVERWDGRSWAVQTAPTPGWADRTRFDGVSCVSQTLCSAVGTSVGGQGDVTTRLLVERWDGTGWTIDRAPLPDGSFDTDLSGVACTSSVACTAVGDVDGAALVERWNGSRWSIQPTPHEVQAPLSGVSCASVTMCEAVGAANLDAQGSTAPPPEMVAERWNGRRWSLQHVPSSPDGSWLSAVACPSMHSCVALGSIDGAAVLERYPSCPQKVGI